VTDTNLKTIREKRGLTQEQVAQKANISTVNYQRIEYGRQIPRADTAKLIAKALNTTVEKLF
jgi:transcriptional regulator with XRE-family HTH domain